MPSMQATTFRIHASSHHPAGDDWHAQLVSLLGSKPRRLSRWCEAGLLGALSCVRQAGHASLSDQVAIRIYTEYGTASTTRTALMQAKEHMPMPFTFMQTQPGQLFNALGTALGWHGDGYTTSCNHRGHSETALVRGIRQSALLAWVDEEPALISHWIWLEKTAVETGLQWQAIDSIFQVAASARWLKIAADNQIFQAS